MITTEDKLSLKANAVKCLTCEAVIWSTHRHDFQPCNCLLESTTRICVDGGDDYARRVYGKDAKWLEWINGVWIVPFYAKEPE